MQRKGMARFAPLAGLLFLLLAVVSFALGGDPPDSEKPPPEVVEYWEDSGKQIASAIIATYAALALVWFAGSVRDAIARVEPGTSRLASIAFGGAVICAAGLCVNNAIQFATAETAGELSPEGTQALSALFENFYFPMAAGMALFLLASGIAAVRHGAFDKRLGWIAVVIGVLAVTPAGFPAFIASLAWVGIAGVVLYRKTDPVGSGAEPPAAGGGPAIHIPPGA